MIKTATQAIPSQSTKKLKRKRAVTKPVRKTLTASQQTKKKKAFEPKSTSS